MIANTEGAGANRNFHPVVVSVNADVACDGIRTFGIGQDRSEHCNEGQLGTGDREGNGAGAGFLVQSAGVFARRHQGDGHGVVFQFVVGAAPRKDFHARARAVAEGLQRACQQYNPDGCTVSAKAGKAESDGRENEVLLACDGVRRASRRGGQNVAVHLLAYGIASGGPA